MNHAESIQTSIVSMTFVVGCGAQQFGRIELKPAINAPLLHAPQRPEQAWRIGVQFAGLTMKEKRNGHSQVRWRRCTSPASNHACDALLAPCRKPLHASDGLKARLAQVILVEADEPLWRGSEDQRCLVPPAVRVAVLEPDRVQQMAALPHQIDDPVIGRVDVNAFQQRRAGNVNTAAVHRVVHRQPVAKPRLIVVLAVSRRGVNSSCAGVQRYVVSKDYRHFTVIERMRA